MHLPEATPQTNTCALCSRNVNYVTLHHLIPKEEGGQYGDRVPLCQPCHTTLHSLFTNKELKNQYNTIERLRNAERLQTYLNWIQTKRIEKITNRRRKN